MSDKEWEPPPKKRLRVFFPDDDNCDNFDAMIDCSTQSEEFLQMDGLKDKMSGHEVYDENCNYSEHESVENDLELTESDEINTDWSDTERLDERLSEPFEDDHEPTNLDEKEICDFVDQILNDEFPPYLPHSQNSEVMSPEQFQVFINEKVAQILLNKCTLKSNYCSNSSLLKELDYWIQRVEKLEKKTCKLQKITEKMPLKPPDKIYHVRNTGVLVNMLPLRYLRDFSKHITPKVNDTKITTYTL